MNLIVHHKYSLYGLDTFPFMLMSCEGSCSSLQRWEPCSSLQIRPFICKSIIHLLIKYSVSVIVYSSCMTHLPLRSALPHSNTVHEINETLHILFISHTFQCVQDGIVLPFSARHQNVLTWEEIYTEINKLSQF